MATKITVPALPESAIKLAESDEMLAELLDGFRMPIKMAQSAYDKLYQFAVQNDTIAERIETGEDEASVTYRQIKADQDANVAAAEQALKAAREAADKAVAEAYEQAAKGVRKDDDVSPVDRIKALERIKLAAARTARDVEILSTYGFGDVMGDWKIPLPTGKGARDDSANKSGEDRGFYPQFSKITVNGSDIVESGKIDAPVVNQLVKTLAISRDSFIDQLSRAANGKDGWQALEAGTEVPVSLTINDKPVRIVVTKGVRGPRTVKSDSAPDTATVLAVNADNESVSDEDALSERDAGISQAQ